MFVNFENFSFNGCYCFGKVVDIYDNDTIKIIFPLIKDNVNTLHKWNCKLINVYKSKVNNKYEKELNIKVRDILRNKILNKIVNVRCLKFDENGKILVEIFNENININNWLINNQMASKEEYDDKKVEFENAMKPL